MGPIFAIFRHTSSHSCLKAHYRVEFSVLSALNRYGSLADYTGSLVLTLNGNHRTTADREPFTVALDDGRCHQSITSSGAQVIDLVLDGHHVFSQNRACGKRKRIIDEVAEDAAVYETVLLKKLRPGVECKHNTPRFE